MTAELDRLLQDVGYYADLHARARSSNDLVAYAGKYSDAKQAIRALFAARDRENLVVQLSLTDECLSLSTALTTLRAECLRVAGEMAPWGEGSATARLITEWRTALRRAAEQERADER